MSSLTILMYHYVRKIEGSAYPRIKGLELEGFRRQLDYLESNYKIITAGQLIDFACGRAPIPEDCCLLTFDDGYKDHVDHVLPELMQRNLQGSFFPPVKAVTEREILNVNRVHFILACNPDFASLIEEIEDSCRMNGLNETDLADYWNRYGVPSRYDTKEVIFIKRMLQHALPKVLRNEIALRLFEKYVSGDPREFANELYMSSNDVEKLVDSGMYVGSHGSGHLWLNTEPREIQEGEIDLSLKFLDMVGAPTENWIMCYPFGAYNSDTLDILTKRKCRVGLTTKVGVAELNDENLLELSRFDTNDFPQ